MITIVSQPKEFQLNKNPILLKLSTDNQFDPVGVKSEIRLVFTQGVVDGDDFTLEFGDGTVLTFTFRNTPNSSGLEIPTSNDPSILINNVLTAFNKNYYISSHFSCLIEFNGGLSEGYVDMIAVYTGDEYNATLTTPPLGMSLIQVVTGVTQVERLNFGFMIQLLKRSKGTTTWTVLEDTAKPFNGATTVNLSEYLDDEYWASKLPDLSVFASIVTQAVGEYKVRYAESWGLPRQVQSVNETGVKFFTNGGLSRDENFATDFYDGFLTTSPPVGIMSWINHPIELYPDELHVLSYLRNNSTPGKQIALYCEYTALDGAKSTTSIIIGVVGDYDVATFKVTPSVFSLDTGNLRSMKVWIAETDQVLSPPISKSLTFVYNSRKPVDSTCLIYENGLGFFDTFNLRGNRTAKVAVEKTKASRVSESYISSQDHFEFVESILGNQSWEVNTGHLNKGEMSRVYDLLLSERVYLRSGQNLIPVSISGPSDLPLFNSRGSRTNNVTIEIQKITDNRYGAITTGS